MKLNQEEYEKLKQLVMSDGNSLGFVQHLMDAYGLNIISLTKGHKGSDLYTRNGNFGIAAAKTEKVVDSVGAGDAYAAVMAAGMLQNWPPDIILERASLFSSAICRIKGAIPDSESFYEPFKSLFMCG